jgi:hypothetical protein
MGKRDEEGTSKYTLVLSDAEVANYWRLIGISKRAWDSMTKTRQAQLAWEDMYAKQRAANDANRAAQEFADE